MKEERFKGISSLNPKARMALDNYINDHQPRPTFGGRSNRVPYPDFGVVIYETKNTINVRPLGEL